jgi:hypothetical protein
MPGDLSSAMDDYTALIETNSITNDIRTYAYLCRAFCRSYWFEDHENAEKDYTVVIENEAASPLKEDMMEQPTEEHYENFKSSGLKLSGLIILISVFV